MTSWLNLEYLNYSVFPSNSVYNGEITIFSTNTVVKEK